MSTPSDQPRAAGPPPLSVRPPWGPDTTAVVLDLDGTLHDDAAFAEVYLAFLAEVAGPAGEEAVREARAIVAGQHAVPLGALYDPELDEVRPGGLLDPGRATRWDGRPIPDADPAPATRTIYLGDPWQVVRAAARNAGVPLRAVQEAFGRIRRHMNDPATPLPGQALAERVAASLPPSAHRVLLSNTPDELARPLIERLGVVDAFDEIRLGADKPAGLAVCLDHLLAQRDPATVWVVGDNLRNDIAPANERGCRTVAVDPLGLTRPGDADVVVTSLADLVHASASV